MKAAFATTENSIAFYSGIQALRKRGSRESSWLLATGDAGHGKSSLVQRFTLENGGVYLRAKAHWTKRSLLRELVEELGHQPEHRADQLFNQACRALAIMPRPLAIDELDHIVGKADVLETIRDLSDLTEVEVIVVGMENVEPRLKRFKQIYSRVSQVVRFRPLGREDVRNALLDLCEVEFEDAVVDTVLAQTAGYLRELMDAVATVEAIGRRAGAPVTAAMVRGVSLIGGRTPRTGGKAQPAPRTHEAA